jgi:protoporphyrinogen oxidase
MVKIGIIGGGISGLSAAHYLSKLSKPNIEKVQTHPFSSLIE